MATREDIEALVDQPRESLNVELKPWLDLDDDRHKAEFVRACLALFNSNGGFLLIGFNDKTLKPKPYRFRDDVAVKYHADTVLAAVTRHASRPIDLQVEFVDRGGQEYPCVIIPEGVNSPVVATREIKVNGRFRLERGAVYTRTLKSNGTPSTSKAQSADDWDRVIEHCLSNREAEVGGFLRRHLAAADPQHLAAIIRELAQLQSGDPGSAPEQGADLGRFTQPALENGASGFRRLSEGEVFPEHGSFEFVACLSGVLKNLPWDKLIELIQASNPQYTGFSLWRLDRGSPDPKRRPNVVNGCLESLIDAQSTSGRIDYWMACRVGALYVRSAFQEDVSPYEQFQVGRRILEFSLPMYRVSEAIAVSIAIFRDWAADKSRGEVAARCRWTGLSGRTLGAFIDPLRYVPSREARQDVVESEISYPLSTPESAIPDLTRRLCQTLFETFEGMTFQNSVYEEIVGKMLKRSL